MNLLFVGGGKGGSWAMRGVQLGAALGARVTSSPSPADFAWCDVVVLVKRAILQFGASARQSGKPVVWDALDFWAQPGQNALRADAALQAFRNTAAVAKTDVVIGATQKMADAIGGLYLTHHSWDGLCPTPAREQVQTVAYQGAPVYLGRWADALRRACDKRGWTFLINPPDLRAADILVAFRDGVWDGWLAREWKSGVKLVNAIAAGRPIITQDSAAAAELKPYRSVIESLGELDDALDYWTPFERRSYVAEDVLLPTMYTLPAVAEQYRSMFLTRLQEAA